MSLAVRIMQKVQKLPESLQSEILDFVDFLDQKKVDLKDQDWKELSLSSAMRGMEDEALPEYTVKDLKERFQ